MRFSETGRILNRTEMASMDMIDPELAAVVAALTEEMMASGISTLPERGDALGLRALLDLGIAGIPSLPSSGVLMSSYLASTPDGSDIELCWYSIGFDTSISCPAVVYLHGGGMIGGKLDYYNGLARHCVPTIESLSCTLTSRNSARFCTAMTSHFR